MNQGAAGPWINVDPSEVVGSPEERDGIKISPSPYDIPLALRINESDPTDPEYAVELKYVGSKDEKKQRQKVHESAWFECGTRSGRVYNLFVDPSSISNKSSVEKHESLSKVIEDLNSFVSNSCESKNYYMVLKAMVNHSAELEKQLKDIKNQLEKHEKALKVIRKMNKWSLKK